MGISEISKELGYNKSTVFNIVHTLADLGVLEHVRDNKYRFGLTLYLLGKAAVGGADLIQTIHPFLEKVSEKTGMSAFLGIRSGLSAVILDKVDSDFDIKVSSDIGMRLPLLAGAGGKALLCQLPDREIEGILSSRKLTRFTHKTCMGVKEFLWRIRKVRVEGIAFDDEEYIEGVFALAAPIRSPVNGLQAAIWAVGLKTYATDDVVPEFSAYMKKTAEEIGRRFFMEVEGVPGPRWEGEKKWA